MKAERSASFWARNATRRAVATTALSSLAVSGASDSPAGIKACLDMQTTDPNPNANPNPDPGPSPNPKTNPDPSLTPSLTLYAELCFRSSSLLAQKRTAVNTDTRYTQELAWINNSIYSTWHIMFS